MRFHRKFGLGMSGIVVAAGLAYAADQTILGNSITVKDPKPGVDATKRKITGKAKEKNSANTIVGNPSSLGGTLFIAANGGTDTSQTFSLPQGTSGITGKPFWTSDPKGHKYKDPKGENGPVKLAQIKKTPSGTFTIKAVVSGKLGPVNVLPPNPGTDSCLLLGLNGGDTYSVAFTTGLITNKANTLYKHKKPTVEGTCVTTTSIVTTTTSSTTTSTTLYGSPSRAFVDRVMGLLD
jgi:hypothetical protein